MKLFQCSGCGIATVFSAACRTCHDSVKLNEELLPSPTLNVKTMAPLFFSLGTTHSIFKAWKNHPGVLLERHLFRFHPALVEALKHLNFDSIVPIPQDFSRSWERGHASAVSIARAFSEELDVPMKMMLEMDHETVSYEETRQAKLHAIDRAFALNFFTVRRAPEKSERILIVDDLITTGNTLARAAELLLEAEPTITLHAGSLGYRPRKGRTETALAEQGNIKAERNNESRSHQSESNPESHYENPLQYKI